MTKNLLRTFSENTPLICTGLSALGAIFAKTAADVASRPENAALLERAPRLAESAAELTGVWLAATIAFGSLAYRQGLRRIDRLFDRFLSRRAEGGPKPNQTT